LRSDTLFIETSPRIANEASVSLPSRTARRIDCARSMSAQTPVTQTSFDPLGDRRGLARPEESFAPLEIALAEARDPRAPVLERLRLLAPLGRRIDAIFQRGSWRNDRRERAPSSMRERLVSLQHEAHTLLREDLLPELAARGLALTPWRRLSPGDRNALSRVFATEISPLLTPLTVDATHPFPCVASLALNVGVLVRKPGTRERRFVGVEVPPALPRFVSTPSGALVCIEEVVRANLELLLPGLDVISHRAFRVTREGRPLRSGRTGPRTRAAVRVEVEAGTSASMRRLLARALELAESDVDEIPGPLDLTSLAGPLLACGIDASRPTPLRAGTQRRREHPGRGVA
jgi:polyphosphate kinase